MCDYSLHNVMSTPAKVGDELTTTRFRKRARAASALLASPKWPSA